MKNILVYGAGSIGKRHIANLLSLGMNVFVWRKRSEKNQELLDYFNHRVTIAKDFNSVKDKIDAIVISNSTSEHREILELSIQSNKHIYIEKPITTKISGIDNLAQMIKKRRLIVEVGCQLRKHPALDFLSSHLESEDEAVYTFRIHAGQRLEDWRPGTDYRKSYSSKKNEGGGALLDIIHEIDLALWLLGDVTEVYGDLSNISDQSIEAEDLANIIMKLDSGAVGQVQLDLLSPILRRGIEIVTKSSVYTWNYSNGNIIQSSKESERYIYEIDKTFDRNDMFISTMKNFISRISGEIRKPSCSFDDGIKALKVVDAIEKSYINRRPSQVVLGE